MKRWNKEQDNHLKINMRPITGLLIGLGFLSAILLATMLTASQNSEGKISPDKSTGLQEDNNAVQAAENEDQLLAVVKEIDTGKEQITLFDVNRQEPVVLSYNGGTNFTNKYGKLITISQVAIGSMVDAFCDREKSRLTGMNISKVAWVYPGVKNMSIDLKDKIMKIASTKYKYTDDILVLDGEEFIPADNLTEQDVLTVWGNEETIYSIIVTRGHGTVKLRDYEDYIGNSITIGYESMQQITGDTEVTVREGTFNLTVENGRYSATKSVTVRRNEVTYVSLGDLGPNGLKLGKITFEITPAGADLYIDKKLTVYSDPIELCYGEHSVIAALGGYTTYQGTIDVDSERKTININLPEAESSEEAVVTETDTSPDTGTSADEPSETAEDNPAADNPDSTAPEGGASGGPSGEAEDKPDRTVDKAHKIYVKTPDGASVYLDGDFMGIAPCDFQKIIGSHVLTFIKDGYETTSYTVEVANDGVDAYFTFPSLTESE